MLKVALAMFLLRISVRPVHVWMLRIIIMGASVFGMFYVCIVIFQCHPISAFWEVAPGSKSCMSIRVILGATYAAATLNALADWVVGILPIFIVRPLALPTRTKAIIAAILAFAAVSVTLRRRELALLTVEQWKHSDCRADLVRSAT